MTGKRRASTNVTIIDIAREAGVSKSTVSLVLKGSTLVADETRDRVSRAMSKLGYVYNRGAANLRGAQSSIVGMVINDLSNPFFAELAIGIERVLRTSGYIPFIANTAESVVRQAEVVRSMREHGASGIILSPALDTDGREINSLLDLGMPIILAIRRVPGARASLVASDNMAGAARVTQHLISLGHRRIAFLGGMGAMAVRKDRIAGFTQALEEVGLRADPALMLESMPTKDGAFTAMSALLSRPDWPTAVVCFNDVVAIGVMQALSRKGLLPGRDMAITGFDDTTEARQVSPPLTTVSVDAGDLGERAAQMLLRQIAAGNQTTETYIGEARLVVRESCCPPPRERKVS
ncbi:LacI family DNA-binding transcriptional regulator [Microvirga aerophila]|uniref:Transcriptional regulator n=1 Tax=Microvirga aerophila TaxID=670291 RepID=A0A512BLM7_9HYPH|nr:LacI family DNA-binding transcriptional regulator [Microvirga aerophila]GEO12871.1 transcriptional regulator [Microvirga aerophila]